MFEFGVLIDRTD